MQRVLDELICALRGSGLEPGLSECIEARRAAALVGFGDRTVLRETLGATLAKSVTARGLFDDVFERYFAFIPFDAGPSLSPEADVRHDEQAQPSPVDTLLRMIETGDRLGLARRLRGAEQTTGLRSAWLFTQRGLYTRRIVDAMGGGLLLAEQSALERPQAAGGAMPGTTARIERLRSARETLFEEVRAHVARQLDLYGAARSLGVHDAALEAMPLSRVERRDFERMHVLVRALARRLATRHGRRQHRRRTGRLDVPSTFARNARHGGLPFEPQWRTRIVQKPRVIAICDVSRSVQAHARFLLLLLYSLRDVLPNMRSFAFTHRLVDVSRHFEAHPPEAAIEQVLREVGGTGTNYGTMLADFARQELAQVDRRTAVIFIGDARNNRADPRLDVMRSLYKRARRVVWLNPEARSSWGLGDSEMLRYAPCCHAVRECATLAQLARAVDGLLRSTSGS